MTLGDEPKTRSDDRVFIFAQIDDKLPKNSFGVTDPRLVTGENRLHAKKDPETCLWLFKQEQGVVPEKLKCMFTSFNAARKFAEAYYSTRNIKIVEVED
jgi:hypothetical protein